MALSTLLKPTLVATGAASLVGLGSLALTAPAHAAQITNFRDWEAIGDVLSTPTNASLSNNALLNDDVPNADSDYNFSVSPASDIFSLTNSLGLPTEAFDLDPAQQATEGSAIKFTGLFQAGDRFSFNWLFRTNETTSTNPQNDYAFFVVNGEVISLAGIAQASQPDSPYSNQTLLGAYEYLFTSTGTYDLGLGVVDIGDFVVSSALELSNAQFIPGDSTPIPTPALLPGLVGLGLAALRKKREDDSELSA